MYKILAIIIPAIFLLYPDACQCQQKDSVYFTNQKLEKLGMNILDCQIIGKNIIQSAIGNLLGDTEMPPDTFVIVKNLTIKIDYPFHGPITEIKNYENLGVGFGRRRNHYSHKVYQPKINEWKKINDTSVVIKIEKEFPILIHSEISVAFYCFPILRKVTKREKSQNDRWIFTVEKSLDIKNPVKKILTIKIESENDLKADKH